ncbi:hypothetical protein DF157_21580 [Burkholderia cenocepacia]|nr:hypothetical protein DF157_21580 [Burkholderia cenocepacia]RQV20467.1 hypothetical protein DF030_22195 [Burkholderia cenocepacia]RQV38345.1 hypothetical protein DF028_19805 [Burkholderia cenocepacia]RQV41437.1 hypothetical protein DF027_18580 [Burkholderia cenocepacia]RQV74768.1 hypothetical protein DF010_21190 [Burkholderia cenocepacia]
MPFVYSIMRFLHDRDFSQIRGRFAQERPRSAVHRVREKPDRTGAGRPRDSRSAGAAGGAVSRPGRSAGSTVGG